MAKVRSNHFLEKSIGRHWVTKLFQVVPVLH